MPLLIGERGAATGARAGFGMIFGVLRLVTARWIVREGTMPRPHNRWRGGGGLDRSYVLPYGAKHVFDSKTEQNRRSVAQKRGWTLVFQYSWLSEASAGLFFSC